MYGCDYGWIMNGVGDPPEELLPVRELVSNSMDNVEIQILTRQAITSYPWDGEPEITETISMQREIVTVDDRLIVHAARCSGDSMRPTLFKGSLIGIEFENYDLADNCLFVVQFSETGYPVVRRLTPRAGGYLFVADTPTIENQFVAHEYLDAGEVRILGRVRWVINKV